MIAILSGMTLRISCRRRGPSRAQRERLWFLRSHSPEAMVETMSLLRGVMLLRLQEQPPSQQRQVLALVTHLGGPVIRVSYPLIFSMFF